MEYYCTITHHGLKTLITFLIIFTWGNATDVNEKATQNNNTNCPLDLVLGWHHRPPYVSAREDGENMWYLDGVIAEGFYKLLHTCCGGSPPVISYRNLTDSMLPILKHEDVSLLMPVTKTPLQMSAQSHRNRKRFIPLLPFSGLVLFVQKEDMVSANGIVTALLRDSWPFLVLILLFALYGALGIWATECFWNSDQFPVRAATGIWEGFWWSLITMTTIGYGDRAPVSIPGRLFSFVHILTGIVVISLFTAAITTIVSRDTRGQQTQNKQVAALRDSAEITLAAKSGAKVTEFSSIQEVLDYFESSRQNVMPLNGLLIDKAQWDMFFMRSNVSGYPNHYEVINDVQQEAYYGVYFNERLADGIMHCIEEHAERMENILIKKLNENVTKAGSHKEEETRFIMRQVLDISNSVLYGALGFIIAWVVLYIVIVIVQGLYYKKLHKPFCETLSCTCHRHSEEKPCEEKSNGNYQVSQNESSTGHRQSDEKRCAMKGNEDCQIPWDESSISAISKMGSRFQHYNTAFQAQFSSQNSLRELVDEGTYRRQEGKPTPVDN